jgi:hypothetical protein
MSARAEMRAMDPVKLGEGPARDVRANAEPSLRDERRKV